jgi:hypothetical protein
MEISSQSNDDQQPYDPEKWLRVHAPQINARRWRRLLSWPSYEIMSGSLIWEDEKPRNAGHGTSVNVLGPEVPVEVAWSLRPLWHYRTGLIIGEERPYRELWELGRSLFPRWVGFHPFRCKLSRRYKVIYRAGHIGVLRCLAKLDPHDEQPD